jgi:hypothetical protein
MLVATGLLVAELVPLALVGRLIVVAKLLCFLRCLLALAV